MAKRLIPPIHRNALPHCDVFLDNGYTKEEMKLVNETHKILDPNIKVTATAVRIPVVGGHSESVNLTLSQAADLDEVRELLNNTPGVVVIDDVDQQWLPHATRRRRKRRRLCRAYSARRISRKRAEPMDCCR